MNQTPTTDKLPILFKLAALLTLAIFTGCDNTPEKTSKVLKTTPRIMVKEGDKSPLVIRKIDADGGVLIGKPNSPYNTCIFAFPGFTEHPFKLEGKAVVGDSFDIVFHFEDELLENGEIRTVTKSVGVRSRRQQEWETRFPTPTAGENQP